MYNFVYYFIYKAKLKSDGDSLARYSASLVVSIILAVHIGCLYAITRFFLCYYWGISIARTNARATAANNLSYLLFFVVVLCATIFYFNNKRVELIVNRYQNKEIFYSLLSVTKFILIFLLPLLIAIFLVNKSVIYCI